MFITGYVRRNSETTNANHIFTTKKGGIVLKRKDLRDEEGMRLQVYNHAGADLVPITGDDATAALIDMGIKVLSGAPPKYTNDSEGLKAFQQKTLDYFKYVQRVNSDMESERKLMCDIESWAVFLGVTRQTINGYVRRGGAWEEFISRTKELILTTKKVRAYSHQVPPIFAIFDLVNNHGYRNTNDLRVEAVDNTSMLSATKTPEEIAREIAEEIPMDLPDD